MRGSASRRRSPAQRAAKPKRSARRGREDYGWGRAGGVIKPHHPTNPLNPLLLNELRHRFRLTPAARRPRGPGVRQAKPNDLFARRDSEPYFPARLGRLFGRQPFDPIGGLQPQALSHEDLRSLRGSVIGAAPSKRVELTDLPGSVGRHPGLRMLGAEPSIHQAVRQPERTGCETVPAEMARLPGVDALRLNRTEHRTAQDPATAIASTMRANQANRLAGTGGQGVEVEVDELFVPTELELRCLRPIAVGANRHEQGTFFRAPRAPDQLQA